MAIDSQGSSSGPSLAGGWAVPLAEQEGPHLGTSGGSKARTCEKAQGMVTRPLPHGWPAPALPTAPLAGRGRAARWGEHPVPEGPERVEPHSQ